MQVVNLYQSDVRSLSDAEIETLADELQQEYCASGCCESYWTDDAAETRYYELRAESGRRRWAAEHPEDPEGKTRPRATINSIVRMALEDMARAIIPSLANSRYGDQFAGKVGETIEVRRPARVLLPSGDAVDARDLQ